MPPSVAPSGQATYDRLRSDLVLQLRNRGITDPAVLEAIGSVPRELFVPPAIRSRAYEDTALPIDALQTISQPFTVARMTEAANVRPGMRALEIGTGSGYQAAILARMGVRVYTVERHAELSHNARQALAACGYGSVECRVGDGTIGWSSNAPYDAILVTAGAPDVPEPLARQLTIGGRLIVPVGGRSEQTLYAVQRNGPEEWAVTDLGPYKFVPLIGREGWHEGVR